MNSFFLCSTGADPNELPDYSLNFPRHIGKDPDYPLPVLHSASRWGEGKAVEVLLGAGANPWFKDKAGKMAIDWCEIDNPCREVLIGAINKPPSLLELSRKTIIDRFYNEWKMGCDAFCRQTNRIDELDIPETLKQFLRFEDPESPKRQINRIDELDIPETLKTFLRFEDLKAPKPQPSNNS